VELIHKEGALREDMGKYSEAIRWYGRGLKAAEGIEDGTVRAHLRIELSMGYAEARFRQGAFQDCIRRCKDVVEQALDIGDDQQLASAYLLLHVVHTLMGSPERVAFRGLALPIFEDLGDLKRQATVLNNLGIEAYYEGDWDKALDVYARSRDLFERIGDVTSVAMATNNIGEIRSDQGRLEEAEGLFSDVQHAVDSTGHRGLSTMARLNLGRAAARGGRFDDAETLLAEAADSFLEMQAAGYVLETEARRAESDVLRGDRPQEALARAESVLERTGDAADMAALRATALRVRGSALLQLGREAEAVAALHESVRVARAAEVVYETALGLDLLAAVGDNSAAADESSALLERLRVERFARPPLPSVGGGA
jgi:tetratricopeptide (TPR) repeat protein